MKVFSGMGPGLITAMLIASGTSPVAYAFCDAATAASECRGMNVCYTTTLGSCPGGSEYICNSAGVSCPNGWTVQAANSLPATTAQSKNFNSLGQQAPQPQNSPTQQANNECSAEGAYNNAGGTAEGGESQNHCLSSTSMQKAGVIFNQVGQIGGSMVTNQAGAAAQNKAMQTGTQGAVYQGAGSTLKAAGTTQMGLGGANLVMGFMELSKSKKNAADAQNLQGEALEVDSFGNCLPGHEGCHEAAKAQSEAAKVASDTKWAGITSMVQGGLQMFQGVANMKAANQMDNMANLLNNANNPNKISFGADPFNPNGATAAGNGATITGNGLSSAADAGQQPDPSPSGDLSNLAGPPNGVVPDNGLGALGPSGGGFNQENPKSASNGAGGAPLGASSTSAAQGDPDQQAKMAANETVGLDRGAPNSGAGGGNKGGNGGSGGPDLSALLAQFLPKDQDQQQKGGILQYGNRGPASADPNYSLLDRGANIFERIHETYQDKNKRGQI